MLESSLCVGRNIQFLTLDLMLGGTCFALIIQNLKVFVHLVFYFDGKNICYHVLLELTGAEFIKVSLDIWE